MHSEQLTGVFGHLGIRVQGTEKDVFLRGFRPPGAPPQTYKHTNTHTNLSNHHGTQGQIRKPGFDS